MAKWGCFWGGTVSGVGGSALGWQNGRVVLLYLASVWVLKLGTRRQQANSQEHGNASALLGLAW